MRRWRIQRADGTETFVIAKTIRSAIIKGESLSPGVEVTGAQSWGDDADR